MSGSKSDDKILEKRGYNLSKKLGEGSYGRVYMATFKQKDGSTVKLACKIIDGKKAPKDFMLKFFPREIEIMRKVNHPNLIRIHSMINRKSERRFFIFMQFAENGDLLDFIRANGIVREKQARIWFSQLIQGMGYMHGLNIAHRDLKCENLFLNKAYNIKIADFGFARYWKKGQQLSDTYCGSLSYSPPEIVKGYPYEPLRADLWTMGVILFVMCCKSMPFDATHLKSMYDKQMAKDWHFPKKASGNMSNSLKDFIKRLLEPQAKLRLTTGQMWKNSWIREGIIVVPDKKSEKDKDNKSIKSKKTADDNKSIKSKKGDDVKSQKSSGSVAAKSSSGSQKGGQKSPGGKKTPTGKKTPKSKGSKESKKK